MGKDRCSLAHKPAAKRDRDRRYAGHILQRGCAVYVPETSGIIEPIAKLASLGRTAGIPIVYLRHVVRGDGSDTGRMRDMYPTVDAILARDKPEAGIVEPLTPKPGDIVVDKLFYSGFHNTDLDTILRGARCRYDYRLRDGHECLLRYNDSRRGASGIQSRRARRRLRCNAL